MWNDVFQAATNYEFQHSGQLLHELTSVQFEGGVHQAEQGVVEQIVDQIIDVNEGVRK